MADKDFSHVSLLALLLALCSTTPRTAHSSVQYPFRNVSLPWEDRVDDLVNRLTIGEIQDQMSHGAGYREPARAIERLGIGQYMWSKECLHGDAGPNATAFPQSIGMAATFSTDLIFRMAEVTAVEVRGKNNEYAKGGNHVKNTGLSCFSPVINIMRDSRWGRNQETYGEDPYLSGTFAAAYIQGLQGNDTRYVRASGGCKHFDAYGGPENIPVSRSSFNAQVTERDWRMTFLPAFRRCVEAGTYSLMCSYNAVNGIPACANEKLLTEILRKEWGFKGYVVSDGGALKFTTMKHHYFHNNVDAAAGCVKAGCNLELGGVGSVYGNLVAAINQSKVTEAKVREMVKPLFYTRMRLGEFDPPEMNPYTKLGFNDVLTPDHKALALEAAMKSFVLLKNDGILPLKNIGTAGVVGPMANNAYQQFGTYSPHPPQSDVTTPLDALKAVASSLHYAAGCDDNNCKTYNSSAVLKAISGTNIIFVVLGTGAAVEKESHDRAGTELPGHQKTLLLDVLEHFHSHTPVVLLLFTAGPVNISFADRDPGVRAIMQCFLPAQATGQAVRHVLLNDVKGAVPAGRLPYTWPLLASQKHCDGNFGVREVLTPDDFGCVLLPPMVNYSMQGRTYRYFEGEPLYPFGYGLSYTTFEYTASVHTTTVTAGQPLTGSFWVKNTGKYEADEVSQVYIAWRNNTVPAPKLQLVWFKRYSLPTGGADIKVDFEVEARSMALWFDDGWHVTEGSMDIFIGGQQPNQARRSGSEVIHGQFQITGSAYLGKY